ncbi:hypothetical protein D3C86_2022780 [compost metagenome]
METASKEQSAKAAAALKEASQRAKENLDYAKNLAKAMPTVSDDYLATKAMMEQLINRRSGK